MAFNFDWPNSLSRFVRFDSARANDLNAALDEVSGALVLVEDKTDAALKGPDGESNAAIPAKASRINKVLTFDASGNAVTTYAIADVATVSGNTTNINKVAAIDTNVTKVANIDADVTTVAGIDAAVSAVAAIDTAVSAVALDAVDIGTVATNLSTTDTIGTVALNISNVNAVGTDIADVVTVANDLTGTDTVGTVAANLSGANTIGTVASNLSGTNTVGTVAANLSGTNTIGTVAAADTNIGTVATDIANVNTVAGISADVSSVAGIASDVSAVAAQFIGWDFSTTTTMADPGSGIMRLNHATLSSVTAIAFDDLNSAGADVSAYVLTWDDATSTIKGTITIRQGTANFAIFDVTGLTDNAGWTQIAVTHVSSSGTFSDGILTFVDFDRTGDAGTGDFMADGSVPLTGSLVFEGATADGYETTLTVVDPTADRTVTIPDETFEMGFRDVPQSGSEKTTGYTLVAGDSGKRITLGASGALTIPDNVMAADDVVSVFNNTASTATITCSITTAYIAGTDSDKATMTLAARGLATILFTAGGAGTSACVVQGNVS